VDPVFAIPLLSSAFGLAIASAIGSGQAAVALSAAGVLAMLCVLWTLLGRAAPGFVFPRLLVLLYASQAFWVLVIASVGGSSLIRETEIYVDIAQTPLRALVPLALIPIGTTAAALVLRVRQPGASVLSASFSKEREGSLYLVVCAFVFPLYWLLGAADRDATGVLVYAARYLYSLLFFVPFFAGRAAVKSRLIGALWLGCILFSVIMGALSGWRGPFAALVLFVVGRLTVGSGPVGRRAVVVGALIVPLLMFAGIIGIARDRLGRGGLAVVTWSRAADIAEIGYDAILRGGSERGTESPYVRGLERMVAWSNIAVPLLSPNPIPYRGLSGLSSEIGAMIRISALEGDYSLKGRDELVAAGFFTAPANQYGFVVNDETSVEFGLLPDAWSRGGPVACIVVGFLVAVVVIGVEGWILLRMRSQWDSSILLFCAATKCIVDGYSAPLQFVLRRVCLDLLFVALVTSLTRVALRRSRRLGVGPAEQSGAQ